MIRTLAILLVLAAAVWGAIAWARREIPLEVKVIPVLRGTVEETVTSTSSGTVRPLKQVKILSELMGRVDRIHLREGAAAAFDQIVLELDRKALEAQLAVAAANVAVARSQVDSAVMRRQKAEDDFQRMSGLFNGSAGTRYVSHAEFERTRWERDLAVEGVRTAQANLGLLEAQNRVVEVDLARSRVAAPFAGTITRLPVEEGDSVNPGVALFDLMDTSSIQVRAPFDEVDVGKIALGQPVRLALDAFPDRVFPGAVAQIAPTVSTTLDKNRTIDVTVTVQDPDRVLRIGMSVDVVIVVQTVENVLYVPAKSIKDLRSVYVVEAGMIRVRQVALGSSNWDTTEVRSGVQEGELVVSLLDLEVKGELDGRPALAVTEK